jgi:hypothetical protein
MTGILFTITILLFALGVINGLRIDELVERIDRLERK